MRSRTAFTLSDEFRVVVLVNAKGIKTGDILSREEHGHLPLRAWYRRGLIVPKGSRWDDMYMKRAEAKRQAQKEEKIIAADKKNTRRDDLIEIAREIDGFTVDGRWNDDRLEQEIDLFMSSSGG